MVRRALKRQTRWYQNRCSAVKIKDCIVQKQFWKILEFWSLVTSILTWAKKWPKWFRNYFSRAFERRFPFCSTMRRSRDRRGCSNTPPPPSRWWKIQRPIRARVNVTILNRFKTEMPFIYLSNCISLSESRDNISLVGAKCGAAHIPYLRHIPYLWLCHKACRWRWVKRRFRVRLLLKVGVGRLHTGVFFLL